MSAGKDGKRRRIAREAVAELWLEYKQSGDPKLRDRLVLTLAPLVKYIVYKKVREIPSQCEVDDFISCGLVALITSIDRYDPERGATLEQFAWTRIHGAVLDELRRNDWAPRSVRRWQRDISQARGHFQGLYGRAPSTEELAGALSIDVAALDRHLADIACSDVGSLNMLVFGEDDMTIERIETLESSDSETDPEASAVRECMLEEFRAAFERLPTRDRQVATLLYVEGLNLRETGEVLGVSESRVSQIHSQLRKKLREQMKNDESLFLVAA